MEKNRGRKKKRNYVSNKDLKCEITLFKKSGEISESLHKYLYEMAKRIGQKPNFCNYPMRDDMVSDAYLKCLIVLDKFDNSRPNAFGYFSTVIHNFFLDVIGKEKRKLSTIDKLKEMIYDNLCNRYKNIDYRMLDEEGENKEY